MELAKHWRLKPQRYRLEGSRNRQTGAVDFPPAMIKLAEGPLLTAQLTDVDPQDITIGMPVEVVTRKLRDLGTDGLLVYGYKFRPVLE